VNPPRPGGDTRHEGIKDVVGLKVATAAAERYPTLAVSDVGHCSEFRKCLPHHAMEEYMLEWLPIGG